MHQLLLIGNSATSAVCCKVMLTSQMIIDGAQHTLLTSYFHLHSFKSREDRAYRTALSMRTMYIRNFHFARAQVKRMRKREIRQLRHAPARSRTDGMCKNQVIVVVALCGLGKYEIMAMMVYAVTSAVLGDNNLCQFPPDNPIQDLVSGSSFQAEPMASDIVYVYTDEFGQDYDGCVRAVTLCYRPGASAPDTEELLIEIRHSNNIVRHTLTLHPARDRENCEERYTLHHTDCCFEHVFSPPFSVNHNRHYALNLPSGLVSLPLRHPSEMVNGHLNTDGSMLYKPLFYFTIDTSLSKLTIIVITQYINFSLR